MRAIEIILNDKQEKHSQLKFNETIEILIGTVSPNEIGEQWDLFQNKRHPHSRAPTNRRHCRKHKLEREYEFFIHLLSSQTNINEMMAFSPL